MFIHLFTVLILMVQSALAQRQVLNHYLLLIVIKQIERLPNPGRELVLQEGMTFAFEPNCGFGHHLCNLGGTVVVGKSKGIELNSNSTQLMRADI